MGVEALTKNDCASLFALPVRCAGEWCCYYAGPSGMCGTVLVCTFSTGWIGTISKATLGKLLRDGVECIFVFFCAHRYHLELNWIGGAADLLSWVRWPLCSGLRASVVAGLPRQVVLLEVAQGGLLHP